MRPAVAEIDGPCLCQALRAGIARVIASSDLLNRINVYPVPDGDTGTNLAFTLHAVDQVIVDVPQRHAGEILVAAANAAVDGARGNSGAILAEYLQGLADAVGGSERLSTGDLARAFAAADRYARGALDAPQEGTILSVMTAVARSITASAQKHADKLDRLLGAAIEAARAAVTETRTTLPAMRRAGVEDAGARGFLLLLEGLTASLLGEAEPPSAQRREIDALAIPITDPVHHEPESGSPELRFCTECVVSVAGTAIDRRKLRDDLMNLGNSVVIAGGRERVKIHIHANEPSAVFEIVRRYGTVTGEKIDDMHRQSQSASAGSMGRRIAIVTDSAADLPAEITDELGIHVVPLRIHFADRTYLDKVGISPEEFLREITVGGVHPQTSQPAPGDLRRTYEFLLSHYEHVVSISVASRVSGTFQAARAAVRRTTDPQRITAIDSQNASLGQGLIARHAAECAAAGMGIKELLSSLGAAVTRTRAYGYIPELHFAARGGRLPRAVPWIANAFGVDPVLVMGGGRFRVGGFVRRHRDPIQGLVRRISRDFDVRGRFRFGVAHAGDPERAARLQEALAKALPQSPNDSVITQLGPALSVHGGPGTLVVAVQEMDSSPNAT